MAMLTRKNVGMALTWEHKPMQRVAVRSSAWKLKVPGPSSDPYKTDLGIYQGDPAAWHFPKVKTGTLDFTNPDKPGEVGYWDATFAAPWFLLLTSMTHYLAYATQFAVGSSYFEACQSGAMHVALPFLLVAGPMFQAMGGAGPNVMHEYEGFQVAPFSSLPPKDPQADMPEFNNDALRQVAYRGLFQLQAVGGAMVGMGALWPSAWSPSLAYGLLGALAVALYFSPRDVWYPRLPVGKVEFLLPPLPVWPLVLFAFGVAGELAGLIHFFGPVLGTSITLLLAGGGLLEAGLAEGTYDQRWHLFAVVLLNAGGWLQVAAINNWWDNPVFMAVAGAILVGVSAMLLAPGGAVPDLIRRVTSDPPIKGSGKSVVAAEGGVVTMPPKSAAVQARR